VDIEFVELICRHHRS